MTPHINTLKFERNNFDLIRLMAALQVLIVHAIGHFGLAVPQPVEAILKAFPGVPIFFIISGFLVSASLERSTSLQAYFINRILRIYPGLWACFAMTILLVLLVFTPKYQWWDLVIWIIAQLTIVQFHNPFFLESIGVGSINGSLWTIPVELQFYALLPVLCYLLNIMRFRVLTLLGCTAIFAAANLVFAHYRIADHGLLVKLIGVSFIPYLYLFLLGFLMQSQLALVARYLHNNAIRLLVIYLGALVVADYYGLRHQGNLTHPAIAAVLALLVISFGYSHVSSLAKLLKNTDLSYGIYIYHMLWINVLLHFGWFQAPLNCLLTLVLSFISAAISWRFVEKPALRLKRYTIKSGR